MRSRILLSPKYTNLWIPLILGAIVSVPAWAQEHPIDTASSKFTVRAFKTGLFSGFADNHEIEVPITEGHIDEAAGRVKFAVDSRRMKVLDPQMNPSRRQEVQERMLGPEVLDSSRFPQITFDSTSLERSGNGVLAVHGRLSLHG